MIEETDWHALHRDGTDLAYVRVGSGAPAVVLLHGLAGCVEEWQATIDTLTEEGSARRVLAMDQRGHGRSTRHPRTVTRSAYVDDVVALIEHEQVGPVDLVGQSMGAHTALLVAAERPDLVRRLVLVEGGVGGGGRAATQPVADWLHRWPVPFEDREVFAEFFGGTKPVTRAWADGLNVRVDGLWPRWDADVLEEALAQVHAMPRWKAWQRVSAPALIVRGEHGHLGEEADRMVAEGQDARLVTIPGAGHDLHLEAPQAWSRELRTFLRV